MALLSTRFILEKIYCWSMSRKYVCRYNCPFYVEATPRSLQYRNLRLKVHWTNNSCNWKSPRQQAKNVSYISDLKEVIAKQDFDFWLTIDQLKRINKTQADTIRTYWQIYVFHCWNLITWISIHEFTFFSDDNAYSMHFENSLIYSSMSIIASWQLGSVFM